MATSPSTPRYELENIVTSDLDDDAFFKVRRNGKVFDIRVSPIAFINSPATTRKYLSYLEILRSGEEEIDDVYDTDVYEWVLRPFHALFAELAPCPATNGPLKTRFVSTEPPYGPPGAWVGQDFVGEVKEWSTVYHPADVVLKFDNPVDALFKPPKKVLVDQGRTTCFFKPCHSPVLTTTEVQAYRRIALAQLDRQFPLCRFFGVVQDDSRFVVGFLLTSIELGDHGGTLSSIDLPSVSQRQKWIDTLEVTLKALHSVGVIWGDVKAENVLVDHAGKAWLTDFGGGYTQGWVDSQLAGTVEGDLAAMAKLREYLFKY